MKLKITLIVLGCLAWANALSAVCAKGFWAKLFGDLIKRFDLTYAEGLLLTPAVLLILCILTGIASACFWVRKSKSQSVIFAQSENFAGYFCLSAFLFYTALILHSAPTFVQMWSNVQIEWSRRGVYETGHIVNGKYVNNFYCFNFKIPAGWSKASWAAMERKKVGGTFSLWGSSASSKDYVPKHNDGIDTVAAILKYPPEAKNYNPSLVINANDKHLMLEKYGVSNLVGFAEMLTKVPLPFVVDESPHPTNIGGRGAISLKIISTRNGFTINQKIFAFDSGDSYLEFVASTIDDDDTQNLLACLNTMESTK